MPNKQRNIEAKLIYRPVATGQVATHLEAAITGIILAVFGVDLLPAVQLSQLWRNGQ